MNLEEQEETIYDAVFKFVIVANNETEARNIAIKQCADEGPEVWKTAQIITEGIYIGKNKEPFVLCLSFISG